MNYEIIFYRSGKTSEIQNILSDRLGGISLSLNEACAAVSPKELTEMLGRAVKRDNLILIVGGEIGKQNTDEVLDRILRSDKAEILLEEIESNGVVCKIRRAKEQTIIVLPDDTERIISVLPELKNKLMDIYKLEEESNDNGFPENIPDEIYKQMAQTKRVRVAPVGSTAEKRALSRLTALKATIAILLLLAAAQLGAASYLFMTQA